MMSLYELVIHITSVGDLLTLFEFRFLEFQVFFLLSSLYWAVFIFTVSFYLANTGPFWQALFMFFDLSHFV